MPRKLHLSVELAGTGHPSAAPLAAAHWADLIGLAEQGALDFVTVAAPLSPLPGDSAGRLDAVAVLARVAPMTSRIGLVPTVPTPHTGPFPLSTALATLDFVSEGRTGRLVDVSSTEAEAADTTEVAAPLWDSWGDDAEIQDATTGRFIDRERPHHIDFEGPQQSVRGPSIVTRSPQGRPPLVVALDVHDSDGQWELAASHADVVLLDAEQPTVARLARAALLSRVAEAGRDPDALRVLVRVAVDLRNGTGPGGLPFPPAELRFTGAAAELAGLLADWHAATGVDGFHLLPASARADLPVLVHNLLPQLRQRGLFRTAYTGVTLRDHLGLSAW
ncbi:LLM class flavin-dependent oxidoreductase [Streptomyces sp. GESEQ-35]|uniref:LLM class flavin-dependent oxidoreductase n=1 Tax=Streptomyces sp. GESEQ-35 TaxID=2812657 RepID=UPI001B32DB19|nr:LLM class flavin-dependent oxidoreductase [Streptomyces sp. GESEQ-35]